MRTLVIALLLGSLAIAITLFAAGLVLGIAAQNGGWSSFRIALGPLLFFAFERTHRVTSTSFGAGVPLAALAGGLLNAAGAGFLRRRARVLD